MEPHVIATADVMDISFWMFLGEQLVETAVGS
jgi:hypothetical protein